MALTCTDIHEVVAPYIDGELADEDRAAFEEHVGACASCRDLAASERAWRSGLRAKLTPPAAPAGLRARIAGALDAADVDEAVAAGATRPGSGWLPATAVIAAAAAIAVFLWQPGASTSGGDGAQAAEVVPNLIDNHIRARPLEVTGPLPDVCSRLEREVGVPVRPPDFSPIDGHPVAFQRATVNRLGLRGLGDRNAARLEYEISVGRGRHRMTVQVFDATGVKVSAERKRRVADHDVWLGSARGYNVVYFNRNGVGYAITSDVDEDTLFRLISDDLGAD
jgi:anti-sigma factor (TIGR02949 family)